MAMLHMKLKEMKRIITYKQTFYHTHILDARGGVKRSKQFFFCVSPYFLQGNYIKLKGMKSTYNATTYFALTPGVRSKGKKKI